MTKKTMFAKSIGNKICHSNLIRAFVVMLMLVTVANQSLAQEDDANPDRTGRLLRIDLPLTGSVATAAKQQIREAVSKMPAAVRAEDRSVLVLEFNATDMNAGQGSDLGACYSLAEFLGGPELKSVRTVAWIPANDTDTSLAGHAVLVAISCNEIAMDERASIGNAGIDLETVPQSVKGMYQGVAEQRLTLPVPLVLGMLSSEEALERVTTDSQTIFASQSQREKMQGDGGFIGFDTVSAAGQMTLLQSQQMEDFRLIRHRTTSRADLARRFNITVSQLAVVDNGKIWNAVQYKVPSSIDSGEVSWMSRAIDRKILGPTDMVILEFGDVRGTNSASLRLAEYLARIRPEDAKIVAWVSGNCEGIAGVAAMACDDIVFGPEGKLGAGEREPPSPKELESFEITIRSIAKKKDRDWSSLMGIVNPKMALRKYRNINSSAQRLMGKAEHSELPPMEAAKWVAAERVDIAQGIDAQLAKEIGVGTEAIAPTLDVVKSRYQLASEPESLEPTQTERWLEDFAMFLTSPAVSMMLVFGAFICFMNELSAPGLGVFGFLGVLLLTAFFWSHYLEGNAEWFEILLFIVGLVFIGIELFVVPGFGLFGLGGIAMVVLSLVLAGQDFIVPDSDAQFEKLAYSMLPILGALLGVIVGGVLLQKVFPNSPLFKRLALAPPDREVVIDGKDREAVADWSHLNGQTGEAVTPIMPSGKARIDGKVYDVISDGQVIEKGDSIEVTEAIANRVVVRKCT
jgi:membrane-bound ClpP family serine protease